MPDILTVHDTPDAWTRMQPVVRALQASPTLHPLGAAIHGRSADVDALISEASPEAVLVESATAASLAAATAAAARGIPVAHLGAGRRGGGAAGTAGAPASAAAETVRREIDRIAALHLAPTRHAARLLLAASVPEERIVVTGDTVVDAVGELGALADPGLEPDRPLVLVALHSDESAGASAGRIGTAVRVLASRYPRHDFVLAGGPGLAVHAGVGSALGRRVGIHAASPRDFAELVGLIGRSVLVLTDCPSVEEVAPTLNVPVLVLGETTSRPEGVLAGTSAVVGTRVEAVVEEASLLLADPVRHRSMASAVSPFGDGRAAERVVAALAQLLGVGARLPDFAPALRRESVVAR